MKQRKTLKWLALSIGMLAVPFVSCQRSPQQKTDMIEVLSFETQFKYDVLNLLRSNQVERATEMLEMNTFLSLKEIWQIAGDNGVLTNRVCNETFRQIYPDLRGKFPLNRFDNFLPSAGKSLTNFVRMADRKFLITNQPNGTFAK